MAVGSRTSASGVGRSQLRAFAESRTWWSYFWPLPSRWRVQKAGAVCFANRDLRLGKHYQFQVILKPSPLDVQELYLDSLHALGLDLTRQCAFCHVDTLP